MADKIVKANGHIVQADWNQTDPLQMDYIHNKPEIKSGEVSGALVFNDTLNNIASEDYAHAEGYYTEATGFAAHAEGAASKATGWRSHAENDQTTASGNATHAEGAYTKASGNNSHAEGYRTTASGNNSHAEGSLAVASGSNSHAEGFGTAASGNYQHVQGKYNIIDAENKYAHIVGNGTDAVYSERSNAHTLDWNGTAWFAESVKIGGTGQDDANAKILATTDYVDTNATLIKLKIWEETD